MIAQRNLVASSSEAELLVAVASAVSSVSPGRGWRKPAALRAAALVVSRELFPLAW